MNNIHTCSYSCDRPECIKAQRDELAAAAAQEAVRHPDGYHYRYPDLYGTGTYIRKNNGEEVNGSKPVEAVPYWYAPVTAAPALYGVPDGKGGVKLGKGWAFSKEPDRALGTTQPLFTEAPAAPGIDLRSLLDCWRNRSSRSGAFAASVIDRNIRELEELIDASPKGALNKQFGRAE